MSNTNLNDTQIEQLKQPLDPKKVKHRQGGGGKELSYLRGTDVIDRANEIFGFGGWGYDLISNELVNVVGENGEVVGGYYAARLKLQVYGCVPITDEGVCPIQESRNPRAKVDAHDMARKGAITDAMKRAFRCFGDQFGNSLYDTDLVDGQPGTEKSTTGTTNNQQPHQQTPQQATRASVVQNQPPAGNRTPGTPPAAKPVTTPSPNPAPGGLLASEQQVQAIIKLAGRQGLEEIERDRRIKDLYACKLNELSNEDARHFIKVLQEQA